MRSHDGLTNSSPDLPSGFDPRRCPIIAAHFFGLIPLLRQDGAGDLDTVDFVEAA